MVEIEFTPASCTDQIGFDLLNFEFGKALKIIGLSSAHNFNFYF